MPCDDNDVLAMVAARHIGKFVDHECREAQLFLADLSQRTGKNPGPKGGLCLWGMVGNYTLPGKFCEALRDFWCDVYESGVLLDFEHILVFSEPEKSGAANAHEISYNENTRELTIKFHERLPFSWMQA
jgi:hypothetical protein